MRQHLSFVPIFSPSQNLAVLKYFFFDHPRIQHLSNPPKCQQPLWGTRHHNVPRAYTGIYENFTKNFLAQKKKKQFYENNLRNYLG
jgi:hypothetical protein